MIYRRSLFSPRRFHSKENAQDLPSLVSTGKGDLHPLGAEVILDSFGYLLSPGTMTLRKLREIFEKIRVPEVRLCLRAHGQLRQLLQCLQEVQGDLSMRLLRVGCWYCLSLDSSSASELLETCCEGLLAAVDAAPQQMEETSHANVPSSRASGTLKRRRVQLGNSSDLEQVHCWVTACVEEEPQLVLEPGESERSISLLILWRCLRNLRTQAAPKIMEKLWAWFPTVLLQRASSELLWQAFESLARTAPYRRGCGEVVDVLQAARQTLSNAAIAAGCQLSCLRALHALVTFGHESFAPLFTEMLQLLVDRCHDLDVPGSSASLRSVLAILGNLASCSEDFCQELSGIGISRPFSLTLAKSLAWYKGQVADESETQVEVHLNFAMASLLLGWLARGCSLAKKHLEDQLGSTQALLDILRTFTIFQDRCGILTDGSLLCVHTVMQFLADEAGKQAPMQEKSQLADHIASPEAAGGEVRLGELTSEEKANMLPIELTPPHKKAVKDMSTLKQMELTPPSGKTSANKATLKQMEPTAPHPKIGSHKATLKQIERTPPHPKTRGCKPTLEQMELTPPRPKTGGRKATLKQMELTPPSGKTSEEKATLTLKQIELTPPHQKTGGRQATLKEIELTLPHQKTLEDKTSWGHEESFCADVLHVYQRRRPKFVGDDSLASSANKA